MKKILMDKDNRMLRPFAIGLNKGKWYVRIDLWWVGFRWGGSAAKAPVAASTLSAEQVEAAAKESGFVCINSCCDVPQKFCRSDEWKGELRSFGVALLREVAK